MEHWNAYWSTPGVLNSFSEGVQGRSYRGTIARTWTDLLETLEPESRLLDLASGNGGLALLAAEVSHKYNKKFCITAADAANIDPVSQFQNEPELRKQLQNIKFYGNLPAEDLRQFSQKPFTAIISQFGFEYTQFEQSIPEIARALKQKGVFAAICHNSESSIVADCVIGSDFLNYLFNHTPIFPLTDVTLALAEETLPQLGEDAFQDYQAYKVQRNSVLWAIRQLRTHFPMDTYTHWINDLESRINSVFDNLTLKRLGDIRRYLKFHYDQLNHQRLRIEEQSRVALDTSKIEVLAQLFSKEGLSLNYIPIQLEEGAKAWLLTATKK